MTKQKEIEIVKIMIQKYCNKKHITKTGFLCDDCENLFDYVKLRRSKCIFGDDKPFCSSCNIHCYKLEKRKQIKEVMKYSGPRLIFSHPILVFKHLTETIKFKKRIKND